MGQVHVVSDIHGYREDLVAALVRAGLVDDGEQWRGDDQELWVLGDLLDRGPDGIGVLDLVMALQSQAPEQVHMLMGNHEILALGMHRFPQSVFARSWKINGGLTRDQEALTTTHLDWLGALPAVARAGSQLLVHSDSMEYLAWGSTLDEVNARVRAAVESEDLEDYWDVWERLTTRHAFVRDGGAARARRLLDALGGDRVVHGHSIIGDLFDRPSAEVTGPVSYADGLALAVDGGRYDGGPVLVVPLDT